MKYMMRGFSFVVLIITLSAHSSTSAGAEPTPDCEQQLTPATMADLRTLYYKAEAESLPPEQQPMARALYQQTLRTVAAAYSTTREELHAWVISADEHGTQNAQSTPIDHTPPRMIFHPHVKHTLASRNTESIEFSPDGLLAITLHDKTAKIWNVNTGKELHTLITRGVQMRTAIFSPDSMKIVTTSVGGIAQIWDAMTGEEVCVLKNRKRTALIDSATFSSDSTRIVTTSFDTIAELWDATTYKKIRTFSGQSYRARSASFSPDDTKIINASENNTARIWDTKAGNEMYTLVGHEGTINSIFFSPDSKQLVTASSDQTARIWDTATGNEIHVLKGHTAELYSAVFSADSTKVLTASYDRTARIYDTTTGNEIHALIGHEGSLNSAVFSPDGTKVLTTANDGSTRIWDAATAKEIHRITIHSYKPNRDSFSPDGKRIVTASYDAARIWNLYVAEDELLREPDTEGGSP